MKKLLFAFLLLLVIGLLGGATWFYFFRKVPFYHAEDLLPARTIVYFDLPDTIASQQRFEATAMCKIWAEPEVQAFLKLPEQALRQRINRDRGIFSILQEIFKMGKTFEGETFIALTDVTMSPKLDVEALFGFDPGKQRKEAKEALKKLIARWRVEYPTSQIEERHYEFVKYHVLSPNPKIKIAFGRLGNLFLFSYGEKPLQQAIERARGKNKDCLIQAPSFATYRAKMSGVDALLFVNPQVALDRLQPLLQQLLISQPTLKQQLLPIESYLETIAFKGSGVESRSWMNIQPAFQAKTGLLNLKKCERNTLAAAGVSALFYYAVGLDISKEWDRIMGILDKQSTIAVTQQIHRALNTVESQGIHLREDILEHLGSEVAVIFDWQESSLHPSLNFVFETKGTGDIQASIEKLFRWIQNQQTPVPPLPSPVASSTSLPSTGVVTVNSPNNPKNPDLTKNPAVSVETNIGPGNIKILSLVLHKFGPSFSPSFTIWDRFAIFSFDRFSVEEVLKAMQGNRPRLSSAKEFQQADSRFEKGYSNFLYCDEKRLFERIYNLLGGLAPLFSANSSQKANGVNLTLLPKTNTISQHLFPGVWTTTVDKNGFYQVSFGPVHFPTLIVGAAGACMADALSEHGKP